MSSVEEAEDYNEIEVCSVDAFLSAVTTKNIMVEVKEEKMVKMEPVTIQGKMGEAQYGNSFRNSIRANETRPKFDNNGGNYKRLNDRRNVAKFEDYNRSNRDYRANNADENYRNSGNGYRDNSYPRDSVSGDYRRDRNDYINTTGSYYTKENDTRGYSRRDYDKEEYESRELSSQRSYRENYREESSLNYNYRERSQVNDNFDTRHRSPIRDNYNVYSGSKESSYEGYRDNKRSNDNLRNANSIKDSSFATDKVYHSDRISRSYDIDRKPYFSHSSNNKSNFISNNRSSNSSNTNFHTSTNDRYNNYESANRVPTIDRARDDNRSNNSFRDYKTY